MSSMYASSVRENPRIRDLKLWAIKQGSCRWAIEVRLDSMDNIWVE